MPRMAGDSEEVFDSSLIETVAHIAIGKVQTTDKHLHAHRCAAPQRFSAIRSGRLCGLRQVTPSKLHQRAQRNAPVALCA